MHYSYKTISNMSQSQIWMPPPSKLKILTTALCSVVMLKRTLKYRQWISLLLLTLGVAMVQLPVEYSFKPSKKKLEGGTFQANQTVGLSAVFLACLLSGIAGVYFEKVLKGNKSTLWIRNVQLSFFSIFFALIVGVIWKDGNEIFEKALGGIVVALCVAYADNIMKNFATSISILISCLASVYFFDFTVTKNFTIGAMMVIGATYLYSSGPELEKKDSKIAPSYTTYEDDKPNYINRIDNDKKDLEA